MPLNQAKRILCAVRSRPGGEETVDRAIELALESGATLIFCQIVDVSFLNRYVGKGSARKAAQQELLDMANFVLSIICDHAEDNGVEEVAYVVRVGEVVQALIDLVAETKADVLVIGRPKEMPGRTTFNDQGRRQLIAQLEAAGVRVDA